MFFYFFTQTKSKKLKSHLAAFRYFSEKIEPINLMATEMLLEFYLSKHIDSDVFRDQIIICFSMQKNVLQMYKERVPTRTSIGSGKQCDYNSARFESLNVI